MKIQVTIDVPPINMCYYPPRSKLASGYGCPWKVFLTGAHERRCHIFDDVDVTDGYKCKACLEACKEAKIEEI